MKKKILAIFAASMMLVAMLAGCGSSDNSTASNNAASGSAESAQTAKKTNDSPSEEGDLGDYHVKILDAETGLKDYEGNPVIGIRFEYTNNAAEAAAFDVATYAKAFQDGIELETAILDDVSDEFNNMMKDVKTGATITCEQYYKLSSNSDVQVEVTELISLSDQKLEKTFKLAQ